MLICVCAKFFYSKLDKYACEVEVVERKWSLFCQVLVFRLRCDKLSQLKRAQKSGLEQRALSPCKSGQSSARGSSFLTMRMSAFALLQLPQVMTKTFATVLLGKVCLLQCLSVFFFFLERTLVAPNPVRPSWRV